MAMDSRYSIEPAAANGQRLRVLTWHVHGNYLYSLTQVPHEFIVPVLPGNPPGYSALGPNLPWGSNVRMVPAREIRHEQLDCIVYQSRSVFEKDRHELLDAQQLALPCAYIEHNPPEPHPTDTRHFFRHEKGMLVHVTHFNSLMWDADSPSMVIEHGVTEAPGVAYSGELARGIVVVNHLHRRGRRVGADIYRWAREHTPVDLIGMQSEEMEGGLGEVANSAVPAFIARYRYFFTPVRYASLGLSLVEAMMAGLPIVGVAATELPSVITNGVDGYVDTRRERLLECMHQLSSDPELARQWGLAARQTARRRFGIERYVRDWTKALSLLTKASCHG
jgi:hypothetical protein